MLVVPEESVVAGLSNQRSSQLAKLPLIYNVLLFQLLQFRCCSPLLNLLPHLSVLNSVYRLVVPLN